MTRLEEPDTKCRRWDVKIKIVALCALLAAALGGCASGSDAGDGMRTTTLIGGKALEPNALILVGLDANQDFVIDKEELTAGAASSFATADTNNSGTLTPIEHAEWATKWMGDRYASPGYMNFDANMDQGITPEEFSNELERLFAIYDQDKSGTVTREELLVFITAPRRTGRSVNRSQSRRQAPRR